MSNNKLHSIKLTGDSLRAAKNFLLVMKDTNEQIRALRDEYARKEQEIMQRHNIMAQAEWDKVVIPLNLTLEETWGNNQWYLEASFLDDHGDAFLCRRSSQDEDIEDAFDKFDSVPNTSIH